MAHVTKSQLLDLLPPGDTVSTYIHFGAMLIAADWSKEKAVNAITKAVRYGITGHLARSGGHGIYCSHPDRPDIVVFVGTRGRVHGGDEPDWLSYTFEGRH